MSTPSTTGREPPLSVLCWLIILFVFVGSFISSYMPYRQGFSAGALSCSTPVPPPSHGMDETKVYNGVACGSGTNNPYCVVSEEERISFCGTQKIRNDSNDAWTIYCSPSHIILP